MLTCFLILWMLCFIYAVKSDLERGSEFGPVLLTVCAVGAPVIAAANFLDEITKKLP